MRKTMLARLKEHMLLSSPIICVLMVLFLMAPAAQSATDISILQGCAQSFWTFWLCPINIIPDFAYMLIFLGFGVAYGRSHKLTYGALVGALVSYLISSIELVLGSTVTLVTLGVPTLMTVILIALMSYEIWRSHK